MRRVADLTQKLKNVTVGGTSPPVGRRAGAPLDSEAILARLTDARLWQLSVAGGMDLTPSMRRLLFSGPDLAELVYEPGQDLMFSVPTDRGGHVRRRYTIRRIDPETGQLHVDIVVHGDGPGARWAASAAPGSTVEAIGPRGKLLVEPTADWHLLVGDESAIPVTFALLEALPAGSTATVLLEVDGSGDEQPEPAPTGVAVTRRWLHRYPSAPGSSSVLIDAVSDLTLPEGRGHVYLNGELKAVNQLRDHLVGRGLQPEQISLKAYWRKGAPNAEHGEPGRS